MSAIKRAPRILTPEQREVKKARERQYYAEHREARLAARAGYDYPNANAKRRAAYREDPSIRRMQNAKWAEKNPAAALAIQKRSRDRVRDAEIKAAPVIHDADRFERIQEVMASNREKKYGYV